MVDSAGRTIDHGSREQANGSPPLYREYATKIDNELAEGYGNDKRAWGWQIDNQLSHYGKRLSYSRAATRKFREWLREKHGTVAQLNKD